MVINHCGMLFCMRYMGIDYGSKRVGVALSDESGSMGFPHAVFPNDSALKARVVALVATEHVGALVVGDSYGLHGNKNPIATQADVFVKSLATELAIPIHYESEMFSTQEAVREQGRNELTDASAAAIILNSYLTRLKNTT